MFGLYPAYEPSPSFRATPKIGGGISRERCFSEIKGLLRSEALSRHRISLAMTMPQFVVSLGVTFFADTRLILRSPDEPFSQSEAKGKTGRGIIGGLREFGSHTWGE